MSVSIMGTNAEIPIPNGWAGQIDTQLSLDSNRPLTNAAITAAFQTIDHDINQLLEMRAKLGGDVGLVTLSDATDITESSGIALPASEKNAAVPGSLANTIEKNNNIQWIGIHNTNTEFVENNYSSFFSVGNICVLYIDIYLKNIQIGSEYVLFSVDKIPVFSQYHRSADLIGRTGDIAVLPNGNVNLHSWEMEGDLNIRKQIIYPTNQ